MKLLHWSIWEAFRVTWEVEKFFVGFSISSKMKFAENLIATTKVTTKLWPKVLVQKDADKEGKIWFTGITEWWTAFQQFSTEESCNFETSVSFKNFDFKEVPRRAPELRSPKQLVTIRTIWTIESFEPPAF